MSNFKEIEERFIEADECPDKTSIKYQLIKAILEDKLFKNGVSLIQCNHLSLEIIGLFFDADQLTDDMKKYLNYNHFHEDLEGYDE